MQSFRSITSRIPMMAGQWRTYATILRPNLPQATIDRLIKASKDLRKEAEKKGKHLPPVTDVLQDIHALRRVYFADLYSKILDKPVILLVQMTSMRDKPYGELKTLLQRHEYQCSRIKIGWFQESMREKRLYSDQLKGALTGKMCIIHSENDNPSSLDKVLAVLESSKFQNDHLLVAALFNRDVMTVNHIQELRKLPNLSTLRGQLVQLLQQPGQRLTWTLSQTPQSLVSLLERRSE